MAALLDDTKGLEDAYKMSLEAQGSAMEEFEKRTKSIEYHLNQLKAAWQELASSTATAELVNMFIDAARAIVELINKIGSMNTILGVTGGAISLLMKFKLAPWLETQALKIDAENQKLAEQKERLLDAAEASNVASGEIANVAKESGKAVGKTTKMTAAIKTFGALAKSAFSGIAVTIAIMAASWVASKIWETIDKIKNADKYALEEVQDSQRKLADLMSERSDLASKETLTDAEKERIDLLETEIELQEKSLDVDRQRYAHELAKKYSPTNKTTEEKAEYASDNEFNFAGDTKEPDNIVGENAKNEADGMRDSVFELSRAYAENRAELEELAKKGDYLNTVLMSQAEGTRAYNEVQQELKDVSEEVNRLEEEGNEIFSKSSDKLQELIAHQTDLKDAIEGASAADKEILQAELDKTNAGIEYTRALLGMSGANKELLTEQYNAIKSYQELENVYWRLKTGAEVQKEELDALAAKYPEVAKIVEDYGTVTDDAYALSEEGLIALGNTSADVANAIIDNEAAKTASVMEQAQARMDIYYAEADAAAEAARIAGAKVESASASSAKIMEGRILPRLKDIPQLGKNAWDVLSGSASNAWNSTKASVLEQAGKHEEKIYEDAKKKYDALQERIKKAGNSVGSDKSGVTTPNGKKSGGATPPGSDKDKDKTKKKIDLYDKYQNKLDAIQDSLVKYDKAIDSTNELLDINQTYEERTPDLIDEELRLYNQLKEQTQDSYKAQNDAAWEYNNQLEIMYGQLKELTGVDFSKMTGPEIDKWLGNNVTGDFADSIEGQTISQMANVLEPFREAYDEALSKKRDLQREMIELTRKEYMLKISGYDEAIENIRDARTQAETLLDVFESLADSEMKHPGAFSQIVRDNINILADSYAKENKVLENKAKESIAAIARLQEAARRGDRDAIQEIETRQRELNETSNQYINNLQAVYDLRKRELDLQKAQAEKQAEIDIYGEKGQDAWERIKDKEIEKLQDRIDAMDEEDDEEDYLKQLEEKQKEIAELQEKLNNLRNQKTIQQLEKQEDGSYQWKYVEDQKAINETLKEIEEKQTELKEFEEEKRKEDAKQSIQDQIDAIEDEISRRQELYDEQLNMAQESYENQLDTLNHQLASEIENYQSRIAESTKFYNEFHNKNKQGQDKVNKAMEEGLNIMVGLWSSSLGNILSQANGWADGIISRFNAVIESHREMMRELASGGEDGSVPGHANGLRFVDANNMLARLHYGERVLTRQEAAQYNDLEEDIKSGALKGYFDNLKNDAVSSISDAASSRIVQKTPTTNNNNSTQISIGTIELPQVKDGNGFIKQIEAWSRKEFGGLAQKAKIKPAK